MMLPLILQFMLGSVTFSVDVRVRREKKYDTIFWDGDCSKFKASFAGFGEERTCICQKRVNANGKWEELDGTFYQNLDASPNCLYDYRETGANFFLNSWLNGIFVVDDQSPGTKLRLLQGRTHWFLRSKPISIKEVRSFSYKKGNRFTKIASNIFHLTNSSMIENKPNAYPRHHRYYIQVNGSNIKKVRGHLIKIIFQYEYKHHGVRENIGFAVLKVVGDATYDLDLQSPQNFIPLQSQKDSTFKTASITLGVMAGIFAIIIMILIVKQRKKDIKDRKEKIDKMGRRRPYIIDNVSMTDQVVENDYKDQPKVNNDQCNMQRVDVNGNESSKSNTIGKVESFQNNNNLVT